MGNGWTKLAPQASAAPATVCGERPSNQPLAARLGRRKVATTREPGDRPCKKQNAVGCDGMENEMTTTTLTSAKSSALVSVLFVALLGSTLMFIAGHAQSQVLHDAAHDVRHATGFPCH